MTHIILALGSNHHAEENMQKAMEMLGEGIETLSFTPTLRTEAIGMDAHDFLNALAYGETAQSLYELTALCKSIEKRLHRTKEEKAQGKIRIDIDVLQYGEVRLHEEDWEREYVKELTQSPNNVPN